MCSLSRPMVTLPLCAFNERVAKRSVREPSRFFTAAFSDMLGFKQT